MPSPAERFDVAVIGGGASGLWAALELARDRDVLLLEADSIGAGASGAAAGFVSAFEDWAAFPDAVAYTIDRFRWFDGRHGFAFDDRPYVQLAADARTASELEDIYRPLRRHAGYDVEYCEADELEDRWPGVLDLSDFHGGLVNEESGVVRARSYVDALAALARERGVDIRTDTPVERVVTDGDAVTGVETDGGRISTDTVVCAAGARTPRLVDPFVDVPLRPFIYTNVRVEATGEIAEDYPMLYGRDLWWRPEPDRSDTLLVSGGMYFLSGRAGPPDNPPAEFLAEIDERLPAMARDVRADSVVDESYHACPTGSAITPDALPVLDAPDAAPDGLVVAAGVTAGISMSPFTGSAVRSLVTGEPAPTSLGQFRADRFDAPSETFRVHGIRELPSE